MRFFASAKYKIPGGTWETAGGWLSGTTTWDTLFASIAPQLLQEAAETALRESVQQCLIREFVDEVAGVVIERAKAKKRTVTLKDLYSAGVKINDDEFGTILVQLMALGLIRRSDRKRSVKDVGTYWALTPYGETRTIQLRAVKKKKDVGLPGPGHGEGDETEIASDPQGE